MRQTCLVELVDAPTARNANEKSAPAEAGALTQWITGERDLQSQDAGAAAFGAAWAAAPNNLAVATLIAFWAIDFAAEMAATSAAVSTAFPVRSSPEAAI